MNARRIAVRCVVYAWAAPNTALGAVAGLAVLSVGGRVRFVQGAAEFHGGLAGRLLAAPPGSSRFGALTLGHVILGVSHAEVCVLRAHEQVHVRQYERWGVFFLPAYALASLWQIARGLGAS